MQKYLLLLFSVFILFLFCGCEKEKGEVSSGPEVVINLPTDNTVNGYRTENQSKDDVIPDNIPGDEVGVNSEINNDNNSKEFCGNKNSKVFHKSSCGSVTKMKEENKYFADRDTLISEGYNPGGCCKP